MSIETNLSRRTAMLAFAAAPAALSISSIPAWSQSLPDPEGTVDMEALLADNPLEDVFEGDENAPVTIVEYASMTCPHCANFHINTLPAIKEKYIETGKARIIMREFPFDPRSAAAFMLARCAPNDAYFPMVDVLFKQMNSWARAENARAPLENIAKLAGFTQESFEACLTDQQLLNDVNSVRERGQTEFGVSATPTFFIDGKKYAGALTVEQMSAIIDSLL